MIFNKHRANCEISPIQNFRFRLAPVVHPPVLKALFVSANWSTIHLEWENPPQEGMNGIQRGVVIWYTPIYTE